MIVNQRYKRFIRYVGVMMIGIVVGLLSFWLGTKKIMNYMEGSVNTYSKFDLINIISLTDEFSKFVYLNRSDISLFFLPFLFWGTGIMIVSSEFLLKPKSYITYIYSRVNKKSEAMRYIKGNNIIMTFIYVFSFLLTLCGCLNFFLPKGFIVMQHAQEIKFNIYITLYGISTILAILFIVEIMFLLYCNKGVSSSFIGGLIMIIVLFLIDIQMTSWNLILFTPTYYFLDSLCSMFLCYLLMNKVNAIFGIIELSV